MSKGKKRLLVTLLVIVGLIAVSSVVLRLVLTKERLTAMIVPRIEERAGVDIEFSDIGIRFPFGFGVRLDELKLSRDLPEEGKMDLSAAVLNVDVSLMSLVRRKPEIKSVTLSGAELDLSGVPPGMLVEVDELEARLSMTPVDSIFVLDPRVTAGKITITDSEKGRAIEIPPLSFSGRVEAPEGFTGIKVSEGKLSLADLADFKLKADIEDLQGSREFTADVSASGLEAGRLADLLVEKGLVTMPADQPAFVVESGTVGLQARAAGMASDPAGIMVSGEINMADIVISSPGRPALTAGGTVAFSDKGLSSKEFAVRTEKSEASAAFTADIDKATRRPGRISFDVQAALDLGELYAMAPSGPDSKEQPAPEGTLKATAKGSVTPPVLKDLFPSKEGGRTPAAISGAWKSLDLEGDFVVEAGELPGEAPVRISSLKASGKISGGSVSSIESSFDMDGRPWKVSGEMKNVMPALAELALKAEDKQMPGRLGPVLDGLVNSPDMSIRVTGRAFDAVPFQEKAERDRLAVDQSSGGGGAPMEKKAGNQLETSPVTLLMLKKTFVSVKIDSVISRGALLTSLDAQGRISNGVLRADPVTVDYAGGKGKGRLVSDLRNMPEIRNDIDIDFSGIDAGKALAGFHSAGSLVRGTFAMKFDGRFTAGPGQDILENLTATGRATSTSGTLDFSRFMEPLKATGLNISSIEKFDFHEWTEKFVIDNGRVSSEVWKIASPSGDWDISGSFGFDGTLDYKAGLTITPGQQAHMKDLAKYAGIIDLFRDDQGNILLMLDIGGTAKSPKVRLDQSKAKEKAEKKLLEGAKDKLKDLFK